VITPDFTQGILAAEATDGSYSVVLSGETPQPANGLSIYSVLVPPDGTSELYKMYPQSFYGISPYTTVQNTDIFLVLFCNSDAIYTLRGVLRLAGADGVNLFGSSSPLTSSTALPSPGNPGVGLCLFLPRGSDTGYFLNDVATDLGFFIILSRSPITLGSKTIRSLTCLAAIPKVQPKPSSWTNTDPQWQTSTVVVEAVYGTLRITSSLGLPDDILPQNYILDQACKPKIGVLL